MAKKSDNPKKYQKGRIYSLSIKDIQADPNQPRKHFDETALDELTRSVEKHGVLQPVLFRVDEKNQIVLVSGERRLRASEKASKTDIPAMFTDGNPNEISLIENIIRQDLTAIEESEAMGNLLLEHDYTQEQLAEALGKSQPTISSTLSLNELPEEVKEECRNNPRFPKRELIKLASFKKQKKIIAEFEKLKKRMNNIEQGKRQRSHNKSKVKVAIGSIRALRETLVKIEMKWEVWENADKEALQAELESLEEQIGKVLEVSK